MQFRERHNEADNTNGGAGSSDENNGEMDALRAQGAAFLAAGNAIIDAALSGDSQAFLQANRQQGGQ